MKAKRLSDSQLDKALAEAPADMRAALILSHHAGLRCCEIAALDWAYLTDAAGELSGALDIPNLATKGRTGARVVPLSAKARDILAAHWAEAGRPSAGPVIPAKAGGFTSSDALRDKFKRVYAKAGLRASSHSGRRGFASKLIERNANAFAIQCAMGHQNASTTLIYLREAAAKEAGALIEAF